MMNKFLVLISLVVFSCYNSVGQEKIFVGEEYYNVLSYVDREFNGYSEITYNNNITIIISAKDSLNNEHIYAILFKTGKCISQTHIYNDSISFDVNIHTIKNRKIIEFVQKENNKFYKTYYELK